MKTACILHNIMLTVDGVDKFNWETLDSDVDSDGPAAAAQQPFDERDIVLRRGFKRGLPTCTSLIGRTYVSNLTQHYSCIKESLVVNFTHQYQIGDLHWPRSFNAESCNAFPKAPPINRIREAGLVLPGLQGDHLKSLYVKDSDLRARSADGSYSTPIGKGIFSSLPLTTRTKLGTVLGEFIDRETMEQREADGKGGYILRLNENCFLDCYENAKAERCLMSLANDAYKCYNISTKTPAKTTVR
jgi:hypothetical protein